MTLENVRSLLKRREEESKLDRFLKYWSAGTLVYGLGKNRYDSYKAKKRYTIVVDDDTNLYHRLSNWLAEHVNQDKESRLLQVSLYRGQLESEFISDGPVNVTISGHLIGVQLSSDRDKKQEGESVRYTIDKKIYLTATSKEGKQAILDLLTSLANSDEQKVNQIITVTQWGDWGGYYDLPYRPYNSVVLPDGQLNRIVDDLNLFLESEKIYDSLGLPWHRGYLLHGPPGSGKTSIAKALAYEFKMDLYYIPLSSVKTDISLANLIARVPAKSILLLEDVDIVHATRDRYDTEEGITLSGLLNALDGVLTPPGLVKIMTTNNKSVLDEALIRAGRIDIDEEIGYLTDDQLNSLIHNFLNYELNLSVGHENIVAADVVEVIKSHIHDKDEAAKQLKERFGG